MSNKYQCCHSWVFSTRCGFFWCRLGFWVFLSVTWVFFSFSCLSIRAYCCILLYIVYRTIIRRYSIVKLLLTEGAPLLQNQTFDVLSELMCTLVALPHSSACVERIFSQVNIVKTKQCKKLMCETVSNRLTCKTSGKEGWSLLHMESM